MKQSVENVLSLLNGIIYDFDAGYSSDKHVQYVEGRYQLAMTILDMLEGHTEATEDRIDLVDKLTNDVIGEFTSRGFAVCVRPSQTTSSRYLVIDDGEYPIVRVSDHKSPKDKPEVDIGAHYPETKVVTVRSRMVGAGGGLQTRRLFAAKDVQRLVDHYEDLRINRRLVNRTNERSQTEIFRKARV